MLCVVAKVTDHVTYHVVMDHVICWLQAGVAMVTSQTLLDLLSQNVSPLATSQYWNVVFVAMRTVSHLTSLVTGHLSSLLMSGVVYL